MTNQKRHHWTPSDDDKLRKAVKDCEPLFELYQTQSTACTKKNAWDAVSGRMLPGVCVTGAACQRRWRHLNKPSSVSQEKTEKTTPNEIAELSKAVSRLHKKVDAVLMRQNTVEENEEWPKTQKEIKRFPCRNPH